MRLIDENKVGEVKGTEVSVLRTDVMVKIGQENWKNWNRARIGQAQLEVCAQQVLLKLK